MPRRPRLAKAVLSTATYLRIATYTRRSTDEENQPFTIEAQDTKLDSYANSQDGWSIVAKFSDDASGASVDRPGLQRAIAAAKAGKFDVLLVYRVDRFSRRIRDLVWLLDELDQAGVVFRSATEPFDTSTPAGRMLVQMLGVFAEFEREMIIDRVINGMERKAAKGQWTLGVAPEGLEVDPDTQHLRPVKAELPSIEEIFDLYTVRRQGARAIAKDLNQRGMRRRSGRPWSFKTVIDTLVNPAYIGGGRVPRHLLRGRPPRDHRPGHLRSSPGDPHRTRRAPRQVRRRRLRPTTSPARSAARNAGRRTSAPPPPAN
jgi:site-specific DNA recombinase